MLLVAFLAIAINSPLKTRFSINRVLNEFSLKISNNREAILLKEIKTKTFNVAIKETKNPFIWFCHWLRNLTKTSEATTLLIVSNLFLLLFFSELIALLCRMTTTDVAVSSAILLVFWPASYELSLGSEFALSSFLFLVAIRYALENFWIFSGLALGLLMLYDPLAIGLIFCCLFIFIYFQRHFILSQIIRNAAFFLLPSIIGYFLGSVSIRDLSFSNSALANLLSLTINGNFNAIFSKPLLWQSFTFIFFGIGCVISVILNQLLIYKLTPLFTFALLVLLTPYGSLASKVTICGICLTPITSIGSPLTKALCSIFFFLSAIEIYKIFSL